MKFDCIIAGGGIGGTVLAARLGRAGKRVLVLERSDGPPPFLRPEILWPATAQVLFSLVPEQTWKDAAMLPLRGIRVHDGDEFFPVIGDEAMRRANVRPWFVNPNETREMLLRIDGFELRRGVEVTEVLKDGPRIVGVRTRDRQTREEAELSADWIVGDDGGHSRVRSAAGIEIELREFPVQFLCTALDWRSELPEGTAHIWPNWRDGDSGILAFAAGSLPNQTGVGLVAITGERFDANSDVQASWREFTAIDPAISRILPPSRFPDGLFRVKREWGHADCYGAPGALLMGDAVHPVSPVGGQGANMSVADAVVLGELLSGKPRPDLIAEYERRRRPANERSVRPTRLVEGASDLPLWLVPNRIRRSMIRSLGRHPGVGARLLRSVSELFTERA